MSLNTPRVVVVDLSGSSDDLTEGVMEKFFGAVMQSCEEKGVGLEEGIKIVRNVLTERANADKKATEQFEAVMDMCENDVRQTVMIARKVVETVGMKD